MTTLLLVGCGNMGSALLARWQEARPAGIQHFIVIDPASRAGENIFPDLASLPEGASPGVIVIAVKPQQIESALAGYAERFKPETLYISIAAGKSLAGLANILGSRASIIRAMPNTPALIGEGITALCGTSNLSSAHRETAAALMAAAGKTLWLENEELMDAVTAVSGSGPAYVFYFMEALFDAALQCGLNGEDASALVRQTVKGSALLAEQYDFAELRRQVTSPGGTTEAAINALGENFKTQISQAVAAAMRRAQELKK